MVSPDLIVYAIRSLLKIGGAVNDAWEQSIRGQELIVVELVAVQANDFNALRRAYRNIPGLHQRVDAGGDLEKYWDPNAFQGDGGPRPGDGEALAVLQREAAADLSRLTSETTQRANQLALGEAALKQWKPGAEPPPAFARIALALASVAAEYARTNPSLFAAGEKGEKLVRVLAEQIESLLPDPESKQQWKDVQWNRYYFAERTLAILLQAGLRTLSTNPDLVSSQAHLQALIKATTDPLIQTFEGHPENPLDLMRIQEALLGPVAESALKFVAENQQQLLGDRFAPEKAAGALTGAAIGVIRDRGLRNVFHDDTLLALVNAALGVAASRPDLFLDDLGRPRDKFARDLLVNVSEAIQKITREDKLPKLDGFAVDIAVVVLDTFKQHATSLLGPDSPWEKVAADSVLSIADGLSQGLKAQGLTAFRKLFTRDQATGLVRILLKEMAATPTMLIGGDAPAELKSLVSAVATAMAADKALLLSADDWHVIAAVAAEEAARNPARLFRLDAQSPEGQLGTRLMTSILSAAAEGFRSSGRRGGAVGFGEVLRDAITVTLRAASGNLGAAMRSVGLTVAPDGKPLDNLRDLVVGLNDFAATNTGRVGWREWRWLFRNLVVDAIDDGDQFKLDKDRLLALLKTSPAGEPANA